MLWWLLGTPVTLLALILAYTYVAPRLFGAYYCTGDMGRMPFLTRRGAVRNRDGRGMASIDPYRPHLQGPIVFEPGLLFRRSERNGS